VLTEEERKAQFVVCESYPAYVIHIRSLSGALVMHGYTEPCEALCGLALGRGGGWDTKFRLPTPATKEAWRKPPAGSNRSCSKCVDEYLKRAW
jgi:hypothetical protein